MWLGGMSGTWVRCACKISGWPGALANVGAACVCVCVCQCFVPLGLSSRLRVELEIVQDSTACFLADACFVFITRSVQVG